MDIETINEKDKKCFPGQGTISYKVLCLQIFPDSNVCTKSRTQDDRIFFNIYSMISARHSRCLACKSFRARNCRQSYSQPNPFGSHSKTRRLCPRVSFLHSTQFVNFFGRRWNVYFYFLITYGVCKKRKYCNRMSKEKKKKKKNPSVCLSVWMYVRTSVDTITFEGVSGSKQNLVGVFYVWNVGLVLKCKLKSWSWSKSWSWTEFRFKKTLRSDTKLGGYL